MEGFYLVNVGPVIKLPTQLLNDNMPKHFSKEKNNNNNMSKRSEKF